MEPNITESKTTQFPVYKYSTADPSSPCFRLCDASQTDKGLWWQHVGTELGFLQIAVHQLAEVTSWTRAPLDTLQLLVAIRDVNKKRTAFWFGVIRALEGSDRPKEAQFSVQAKTCMKDLIRFDGEAKALQRGLKIFMHNRIKHPQRSASVPDLKIRQSDSNDAGNSSAVREQESIADEPPAQQDVPEITPQQPKTEEISEETKQPKRSRSWAEIASTRKLSYRPCTPIKPTSAPIPAITPNTARTPNIARTPDTARATPVTSSSTPATPKPPSTPVRTRPPATPMHYATALRASLSHHYSHNQMHASAINGIRSGSDNAWPEFSVWQKQNAGITTWGVPDKTSQRVLSCERIGDDAGDKARSVVARPIPPACGSVEEGKTSILALKTKLLADAAQWPKPRANSQPARDLSFQMPRKDGSEATKSPAKIIQIDRSMANENGNKAQETAKQTTKLEPQPKPEYRTQTSTSKLNPSPEPKFKIQSQPLPDPASPTHRAEHGTPQPKPIAKQLPQKSQPCTPTHTKPAVPLLPSPFRRPVHDDEMPKVPTEKERERKKAWRHLDYAW